MKAQRQAEEDSDSSWHESDHEIEGGAVDSIEDEDTDGFADIFDELTATTQADDASTLNDFIVPDDDDASETGSVVSGKTRPSKRTSHAVTTPANEAVITILNKTNGLFFEESITAPLDPEGKVTAESFAAWKERVSQDIEYDPETEEIVYHCRFGEHDLMSMKITEPRHLQTRIDSKEYPIVMHIRAKAVTTHPPQNNTSTPPKHILDLTGDVTSRLTQNNIPTPAKRTLDAATDSTSHPLKSSSSTPAKRTRDAANDFTSYHLKNSTSTPTKYILDMMKGATSHTLKSSHSSSAKRTFDVIDDDADSDDEPPAKRTRARRANRASIIHLD